MLTAVRRLGVILVLAGLVAAGVIAAITQRGSDSSAPSLHDLKSGVGRVEILNCNGSQFSVSGHDVTGSAFLIGSRVLVSAEHGMWVGQDQPACKMRVRFGAKTYPVTNVRVWGNPSQKTMYERLGVDLATLALREAVDGYLFRFAGEGAPVGTQITALGYPLGGPLAETHGEITKTLPDRGVPSLAAKIDIQGGNSGGPILNEHGDVLSTVSRIVISGSLTDDGSSRWGGVDIPRWWGDSVYADLCRTYPEGGIPACEDAGDAAATKKDTVLLPRKR
jgi:V8-like Glu-specific endopeptidase